MVASGNAAFPDVPIFTPPRGARHENQPRGLRALAMTAGDILSTFAEGAYSRRMSRWNILTRDLYIANDPDLVREAFVENHEILQRKSPQARQALCPLMGDGHFISDGPVWKERRAAVLPIIHPRRMPTFLPIMAETALEWREEWGRKADRQDTVDVLYEMGCLTAEIISRTVFGRTLGRAHTGRIIRNFARYQRHVNQLAIADTLGVPAFVPRLQNPVAAISARRVHKVVDGIIERYLAGDPDAADPAATDAEGEGAMIARLFAARDAAGRPFDRRAVRNEAMVIFMAGHEGTANTLAWAFYLLSQADWARERLEQEVDAVIGDGPPSLSDLDRLVYTRAVVEETMRLYPSVPILAREALAPTSLNGREVKTGTLVAVVPWLLHRNPRLWSRPDDFVPERFLPGEPRPPKYQYVPFGIGPRVCSGMTFGLNEAMVCLAILCRAFRAELVPGTPVGPVCRLTLRPGKRLPMRLSRRRGAPLATPPGTTAAVVP